MREELCIWQLLYRSCSSCSDTKLCAAIQLWSYCRRPICRSRSSKV